MKSNDQVVEDLMFERSEISMRAVHLEEFMSHHDAEINRAQLYAMHDQHAAMMDYVRALPQRINLIEGDNRD